MEQTETVEITSKPPVELGGIPVASLISMYEEMLLIRRFEEKCAQLYGMGKIGGFCHLYNGQEAVATGTLRALKPEDYVATAYRDHGQALAKGVDPKRIMAEMLGKATGTTKGKGGSMHIFDREKNFLGGHGIVGGHIPLATGAAFAAKYRDEKRVAVCFMGDGATNIGEFHESLNLASLWKIPVIYVIENNRYGMGTAVERASAVEALHKKGLAYNMHSIVIEGHDVIEVYTKMKEVIDRARNENLPALVEAETFRYRGHSMSDPIHGHYRTKEEVEETKLLDPLSNLSAKLLAAGVIDEKYLDDAEKRVKAVVQEAVEFAEASPVPAPEELFNDVYAE